MSDNFGNISISPTGPERPPATTAARGNGDRRLRKRPAGRKGPGRKDRPAVPGSRRRLLWVLIPCLLLLPLLYALGGFWLVPRYLEKSLPKRVAAATGMDLAIEKIAFNPFTFDFTLRDLQLQSARPAEENRRLLRIARIDADLAPLSLLRHDLVSNALAIEGFEMHIVRSHDNRYNIEELFSARRTGTSSEIIGFAELPFLFSLNNISLRDGSVTFQDVPAATTHTLEQIELDLPSLSNFPFQSDRSIHPRFSAVINGSKVELTGQASLPSKSDDQGGETRLSCNIKGMDLPQYFSYLPVTAPISLTKGKADGSLELNFSPGTAERKARFAIDFTGRIAEVEIAGTKRPLEATIPSAALEGSFSPLDRRLHIRKLALAAPRMKSRPADLTGLLVPLLPAGGKPAGPQAEAPRPVAVAVDLLELDDGGVELSKEKKAKPEIWSSLQLSIRNSHWNEALPAAGQSGASFDFSGENTAAGTAFSWQGAIAANGTLSGPFRLANVPAATFLAAIGIPAATVQSGKADLQGRLDLSAAPKQGGQPAIALSQTEATLRSLKLMAGKKPWLEAPKLTLTGLSKNGSKVNLGDLRLENGAITLAADGSPDIFTAVAAKDGAMTLNSIDFSGVITVAGGSPAPLTLSSVLLQAKSLTGGQSPGDNLMFSARIGAKGTIKARGAARLAPFQASLTTGFAGLEARTLLSWFSDLPLLAEAQTSVAGQGLLTLPEASFSGDVKLGAVDVRQAGESLLAWKQCDIQGLAYSRSPFHLGVAEMAIDSPVLTWQRSKDEPYPPLLLGTVLRAMLPPPPGPRNGDKGKIAISQLDIQKITLANGRISYRDGRLSPPWSTTILITEGAITDLHSQGGKDPVRLSLSGKFAQADFTLAGTADLFGPTPGGEASLQLSGLRLSDFARQVPPDLGLDPRNATVSVTESTAWKNGRLTENERYVFTGLQTGSAEAEAALPLAFLTDAEGKVVLDVKGERDLAAESIPAVANAAAAFRRQVVKAKVSPLLLAGGEFADLVGSEFAEFQPGGYAMTEQGKKILARFAALLNSHPALAIRVTGVADRGVDGDILTRQLEDVEARRVAEENRRRMAAWQADRDEELARRKAAIDQAQGFIEEDLMLDFPAFVPLKPAPVAVQDSMLKDLARRRADLVRKLLVEQLSLAPDRVAVAPRPQLTADSGTPGNRARLELHALAGTGRAAAGEGDGKR